MFVKYFVIIPSGFVTFLLDKCRRIPYNIVDNKNAPVCSPANTKGTFVWK